MASESQEVDQIQATSLIRDSSLDENTCQTDSLIRVSANADSENQSLHSNTEDLESHSSHLVLPKKQDNGEKSGKPMKPVSFLWAWIWEVIGVIMAIIALFASVVILAFYNGKQLPDWPHGITLNTIISIFATALKALLLIAVTEGISQLKWIWFLTPRPLSHLGRFDASSRGTWGSMQMLWTLGLNHFAVLGILITILSIAIGPFSQQSINYTYCRLPVSALELSATLPMARYLSSNSTGTSSSNSSIPDAPLSFSGSILEGVLFPGSNNTATSFSCPSGNCTFPIHSSLAMCSLCSNAIYNVKHQCGQGSCNSTIQSSNDIYYDSGDLTIDAVGSVSSANLRMMSVTGVYTSNMTSIIVDGSPLYQFGVIYFTDDQCSQAWLDNGTRQENDCIPAAKAYGEENIQMLTRPWSYPSINVSQPNIGASVCSIKWCVKDFNTSVSNNAVSETSQINPTMAGRVWIDSKDFPFNDAYIPQPCYINGTAHSLDQITGNDVNDPRYVAVGLGTAPGPVSRNITVLRECVYQIESRFSDAAGFFLSTNMPPASGQGLHSSLFTGNAILDGGDSVPYYIHEADMAYYPFWLRPLFSDGIANHQSISRVADGLARTLTNWMRSHGNDSEFIAGTVLANRSCVKIQWPWLTLPAVVTLATCVFLAIVVAESRRLGLACAWKSSPFALMLHDLSDTRKHEINGALSIANVYELTDKVKLVLVDEGDGPMLKQKSSS